MLASGDGRLRNKVALLCDELSQLCLRDIKKRDIRYRSVSTARDRAAPGLRWAQQHFKYGTTSFSLQPPTKPTRLPPSTLGGTSNLDIMDGKPKARGGGNSLPFVTIPPPDLPMKNTANGYLPGRAPISNSSATRTLPTTKVGRHRYLELQLEQLRAEIITYAKYADQIAGVVEGCGNTVRTFPQGTNLPFVRTLRQYVRKRLYLVYLSLKDAY